MTQPPSAHPGPPSPGRPQQPGQQPTGRPRPGAGSPAAGAPGFQAQPQYVDYGIPRSYDTSVRPASGLTAARYAPAQIQRPVQPQPQSAWATQTRRVQEVGREAEPVPRVTVLTWIALAVLGIGLLLVLGFFFVYLTLSYSSSPVWWPVMGFLAFLSLVVIVGIILLADRWDPQPIPLLLIAVIWGAAIASFVSFWVNTLGSVLVWRITGSEAVTSFFGPVISAPIVEETTKGLGLLVLMLLARRYFNGPLDGLIYGALIGGGFAFTENILYYANGFDQMGLGGVAVLVVMRGALNIFGHAIYTSLTGMIMGFVARKWGTISGLLVFVVAVIPGMLLHAGWNLTATFAGGWTVTIIMFALEALLSLLWLCLIGVLVWDEARLTRVRLGDYANTGWLTHEEVTMLATWKGRREGRAWAKQIGAKPLMKRFIRESADLASVRQRLLADGANPKVVALEAGLLGRLSTNRQQLFAASGQPR